MFHSQAFEQLAYNDHISNPIYFQISCRQGDPVSSYLFILTFERLLDRISSHREISSIKIDDIEYKLSAYADDTVCLLDGTINRVRILFNDLGIHAKLSGLYPEYSL